MQPRALTIGLVGCGKMGSAMLSGWLHTDIASRIYVVEPHDGGARSKNAKIAFYQDCGSLATHKDIDLVVLAVKPQIMNDVCMQLKSILTPRTLLLSIAAGQTIAGFEKHFGPAQPIIRAMPNTPAAIGKGITVAVPNGTVSMSQREYADAILQSIGQVEWINDESLMDAVTAVSGSGPAYIFYLIETMAKAGEKAGLPAELSMKLARQTVIGSAALAESEHDQSASTLRKNVTSPGGTTEAALKVLMDSGDMQALFDKAIAAAVTRGKELRK